MNTPAPATVALDLTGPAPARQARAAPHSHYGRKFWFAYLANSLIMVAITLLYRYADFVTYLGGNELDVGWIVGTGMVGSLAMRIAQGTGIDRSGVRKVWIASLLLFIASMLCHLAIQSPKGPLIYALRIAFNTAIAGTFLASITSVARRLEAARMAEVIGMLGTSGFLAMALGPLLGDLLLGPPGAAGPNVYAMFTIAAALALGSLVCAVLATTGDPPPAMRRRLPVAWVLRRYHPGAVLVVGLAVGMGIALPATFLPTYAAGLGLKQIGAFFLIYASTAFLTRVVTKPAFQRFGVTPVVFAGLAVLFVSLMSYLAVSRWWHLVLPGFLAGIAHALLYPSVVASGSSSFPPRYRGLGTTMMLGTFDLGLLIGAPLEGAILHASPRFGLDPYPTMFVTVAALVALAAAIYAVDRRRHQRMRPAGKRRRGV